VRRSPRRRRRWLLVIGTAVLLLLGGAFAFLRIQLDGAGLADKIASVLNKRMRGRIEVGAVEWPASGLKTVALGGWVPVRIHDVKVWDDCVLSADVPKGDPDQLRAGDPNTDCTPDDQPDPDPTSKRKPRKLLLAAPLVTADVDVHALMFGHHDFVFRNLWIHGGEALLEQTREPYPLHAYDRTIVSMVTAFYPRMRAGFRAGIYATEPPPIFDLRDIHVEHLNVTLHLGPYSTKDGVGFAITARLEDVNADADAAHLTGDNYLHMDATDPLVAKFYVRLALSAAHGRLRMQDEGPRAAFRIPSSGATWGAQRKSRYDIGLAQIELHRLAQMPRDWARKDYVANTLEIDLTAHTLPCGGGNPTDGAVLHVAGALENYWDRPYDGRWNLGLDLANLGPTLHTCIKKKLGGDNLGGRVTLSGPFIAQPKVTLDLHGLDVDVPLSKHADPLRLTLAEVHGEVDLVNDQGSIEKTKAQIRGGKEPGEIMVSADFGLKPYNATASVDIVKPVDIGRFLPQQVATSVGRYLGGKLIAVGDVDKGFALENFDLTLGPTATDKLVHMHRGRIFTQNDFDTVGIQKVAIEAGKSHAVFDGYVDTIKQTLDIRVDGDFPDLDVWLKRFGLPAFATSAGGGSIVISGPLKSPTVGVRLNLGGVPCMDSLTLDASVRDQIATINHVSSTGLGGQLDGRGVVSLGNGTKVIESFHLEGRKLDASRLCGLAGLVQGTLDSIDVDVHKTAVVPGRPALDWLAAVSAYVKAEHVTVAGDGYSHVALCVNNPEDGKLCRDPSQVARLAPTDVATCSDAKIRVGGACVVARAQRDRGGKLAATIIDVPAVKTAKLQTARHLAGTLAIDDVPLAIVDQFVDPSVRGSIGGLFSATLHLQGSGSAPQAQGSLTLIRSWVKNAFVGDSELQVSPIMVGKIPSLFLHGSALAGQLQISATIGTQEPYPLEVAISGRRVEIDEFVAIEKLIGTSDPIQAWASGTVTVRTELAPLGGKPAHPEAWIELTELDAILNHHSRDGRLTPLKFGLQPSSDGFALSVRLTPSTVELACRDLTAASGRRPCKTQLMTPAGMVALEGGASTTQMNVKAQGQLYLAKLLPLFETQLDNIGGSLDLDATLAGTFDKPTYEAELVIHDQVYVKPTGGDTTLQIVPGGQIRLADGTMGFNQLTMSVKDERANEAGELHIKGTIDLSGWKPVAWGVLIDGTITGKMLLAIAPNAVAQASGLAHIDGALSLFGRGALPLVTGNVSFNPDESQRLAPFSVSPRGARREVSLLGGSIDIATKLTGDHRTYTLAIDDDPLTASIDGDGKIENIRGHIVLDNGTPTEAAIQLDAENLPFRIPGSLDLTVSARDVELELLPGRSAWSARGSISIISGDYTRNFELTDAIKPVASATPAGRPIWDEYPSIGNADLDLTLDVRRFQVKNNIAQNGIDLEGPRILITGTPREPRLSGSIRVQRGEFQIPGTRATFTRTAGSIDFAENDDKATNPHLDITSDSDYADLSGQLHIITLTITGTLENPQWDLKTSTGYNKSQTLTLLFLGRNPEQLRRSLGDQSLGADPTRIDPTTNPSTGFADQIVKDLAGQWVSGLFGDKLTKYTRLDVLRFEVGFGDVGIHAMKRVAENIQVIGDFEQTIRGSTINVTAEFKTPWHAPWHLLTSDQITVQGVYLNKNYYDPAEEDIKDYRGQLVYRLFIPPLFP
jgi:hypothetical protein